MNKPIKKAAFAVFSILAMTGFAHAKTMSVSDVSTVTLSSDTAINSSGSADNQQANQQSFFYNLDLSGTAFTNNQADVTLSLADTLNDGNTVNYTLYNATGDTKFNPANPTGGLGRPVQAFSLTDTNDGVAPSMKLSLLDGVDYLLRISLNGPGALTAIGAPVSAVPLPGAALLFGTALLGFLGFSNRRKV
jgi:hypothetical protein